MIRVLFDVDETILSLEPGINRDASAVMFKKVFHVDTHEEIIDNVGKTEMGIIQEVLEKVGVRQPVTEQESFFTEISDEAYKIWAQATADELETRPPRVLPGILELLTALSKNPLIQLELLTGGSYWRAEEKLKSVSLDKFFRDSNSNQLRGAFGNMADRRDNLFDIAAQQASPEDRFVIVDDSLIGARMAKEHNIPVLMVATGKATEQELRPFTRHVFPDFGDNRWQEAVKIITKQ